MRYEMYLGTDTGKWLLKLCAQPHNLQPPYNTMHANIWRIMTLEILYKKDSNNETSTLFLLLTLQNLNAKAINSHAMKVAYVMILGDFVMEFHTAGKKYFLIVLRNVSAVNNEIGWDAINSNSVCYCFNLTLRFVYYGTWSQQPCNVKVWNT